MDTIVNYAVYENGSEYLGTANVKLPDVKSKTTTINGTGVAGDVEMPVAGHIDAMTTTINFIDISDSAYKLAEQRVHILDLRVAHQKYNGTESKLDIIPHKYILEVVPKALNGGTVAPASAQALSGEYSTLSLKEYVNNELVRDVAPLGFRNVDASGTDSLAEVRSALGK